MPRFTQAKPGQASQRQLRVGEMVRHALAETLSRGMAGTELDGVLVSLSEVRMSPDMKHATVLVAPLAAGDPEAVVTVLNKSASLLRGRVAPALRQMRAMPDFKFRLDTRFEDDSRIDELLRSPEVARDLRASADASDSGKT